MADHVKIAQFPRRSPTAAEEATRILDELTRMNVEGKLSGMCVVYFNPLGGWRIDASSTLTFSQMAIAAAAVNQAVHALLAGTSSVMDYPDDAG